MNPTSGAVYEIGLDLLDVQYEPGDTLNLPAARARLTELDRKATEAEQRALAEDKLVLVSEQVARKIELGNREQRRRRARKSRQRGR